MIALGASPDLFTLMGMVSLPVVPWASKEFRANAKGMNYELLAMNAQRTSMMNEADGQINSLVVAITNKKQQMDSYRSKVIPALEKNLRASLMGYEQNTEDLFVVLDAVESLQMAQLEYEDKEMELVKLEVAYEKELQIR